MAKFKVNIYAATSNNIEIEAENVRDAENKAWNKFYEIFPYSDGNSWLEEITATEIKDN